jgi:D-sedoheptulose 7-phosphate isomerase
MSEAHIHQHFLDNADLHYACAEALGRPLAEAAAAVLHCLTSGGKALVISEPASEALAQHAVACLVGGLERERPPLAAVYLHRTLSGLVPEGLGEHPFVRQIQALGHPGDVLWVFGGSGRWPPLVSAVQAAHAKEMTVLAFTGAQAQALRAELQETDLHLSVPHTRLARIQELHLAATHALCDDLDFQLMGETQ